MKTSASEGTDDEPATRDRVHVGIADYAVSADSVRLVTSGLGSCVGVALHDPENGIAGLAHVMLPTSDESRSTTPAKFADTGIRILLDAMVDEGADRSAVRAKIAGGSSLLDIGSADVPINRRNVESVRQTLEELDISIAGEDVGGDYGRSLDFDAVSGELSVKIACQADRAI